MLLIGDKIPVIKINQQNIIGLLYAVDVEIVTKSVSDLELALNSSMNTLEKCCYGAVQRLMLIKSKSNVY